MSANRSWRGVAVICMCLVFGACAVEAPSASADGAAGWVAGKLVSGAGGAATDAVVGSLMAHAGLDPTTNELREISGKLTQLSNQIKDLQSTSNKILRAVLDESFSARYESLDISTISKFQGDYACYLDAAKEPAEREACWSRFAAWAPSARLSSAVDKFNDLLMNPKTTIVEAYAKSLVATRPFYTLQDHKKVVEFFHYLDDLQVAATVLSVEAENLVAASKGPEAMRTAHAVALLEARTLVQRRAEQSARNPLATPVGVLDVQLGLWLDPHQQRGRRDFWEAVHLWDGKRPWRLPTESELLNMVKERGNKTVKAYLSQDAGMGHALADVPESGPTGELWTSSSNCFNHFGAKICHNTVSTNNAYVRAYETPRDSSGPKFYSFLVSGLWDEEREQYAFLLR